MELKEIKDLKDVIEVADYAMQKLHGDARSTDALWWRGHAEQEWKLRSKVFRLNQGDRFEVNSTARFVRKAPSRYSKCPQPNDIAAWLFLMQHHGLPTRLLDWTESVLIATYFAICGSENKDGEIWALNPIKMNLIRNGEIGKYASGHPILFPSILAAFKDDDDLEIEDKVFPIMPTEVDKRMMVQKSMFTIHNTPTHIEEDEKHVEYLMSFPIPANSKPILIRQLKQVGISVSNLFPDLDHLAEELSQAVF